MKNARRGVSKAGEGVSDAVSRLEQVDLKVKTVGFRREKATSRVAFSSQSDAQ
jgi:hypothetical protein